MDLFEILDIKEANIDLLEKDEDADGIIGRLRYTFIIADAENANKRVYSSDLLQKEISRISERLNTSNIAGQLEHPLTGSHTELSKVSHVITDVTFDEQTKRGTAESAILNTSKGRDLKVLIDNNVSLGASVRGRGQVDNQGKVMDDYELLSIDLVSAPSYGADTMITNANLIESGNGIFEAKVLSEEEREKLFDFGCRSGFKGTREEWQKSLNLRTDNTVAEKRYAVAREAGYRGDFQSYKKKVMGK